jgi:S1-C subfamily serine protease
MLLGLLAWPALSEQSVTLDEIRGLSNRVLCQRITIETNAAMALDLRDEITKRQVDCAMDFDGAGFDYTPEPKEPIPPPPAITLPAALPSIAPKPQEVRIPEGVVRVSTAQRAGSGFFLDPLHVVTNAHVVESSPYVALAFSEGQPFSGRVIFTNPELDFAIIESRLQGTPIPIKRTPIIVGEHITTFGFPQGRTVIASSTGTIRDVDVCCILHDALIAAGSSGGPLLDHENQALGLNTLLTKRPGDTANASDRAITVRLDFIGQMMKPSAPGSTVSLPH